MRAYVIHMAHPTRNPLLVRDLESAGIQVTLVEAIRGSSLGRSFLAREVDQRGAWWHQGAKLSAGQVGCALSHRKAYRMANIDGASWALIVEDDAIVLPGFRLWTEELESFVPEQPTIVTFLSIGRHSAKRDRSNAHTTSPAGVLRALKWAPASAVCYAINPSARQLALESTDRLFTRADWPLWSTKVNFFLAVPGGIAHLHSVSTLDDAAPSPSGVVRAFRGLSKASGASFLISPEPYRGAPSAYWRHSVFPSLDWWFSRALFAFRRLLGRKTNRVFGRTLEIDSDS